MSADSPGRRQTYRQASIILLAAFCVQAPPALAQETSPRAISLSEAIARAVDHNPSLGKSMADARIAEARVLEALGVDDLLFLAGSTWRTTRPLPSQGPEAPPTENGLTLDTGLGWSLPSGGRIGLLLGTDWWAATASSPRSVYSPFLSLSFTHPLLRGAGVDIARAARRRAQGAKSVADLQRSAVAAAVLREVSQSYWELAHAAAQLRIRQAAVDLAREQLHTVEANIGVGKQPPSAAAEVEVVVALRQEELLLAEQDCRLQSLELERLLGFDARPGEPFLTASDDPEPHPRDVDVVRAVEEAMAHSPEVRLAQAQEGLALIEVDVARNALLPQLNVELSGGTRGRADGPPDALRQLATLGAYELRASLTFSEPIGRRGARGQGAAAEEALRKARLVLGEGTAAVRSGVLAAAHALQTAKRRSEVLAKATHLAAMDLDAERARFALGRASNFDVLRRQEEFALAQLRQVRAKVDFLRSEAQLESLTAEIFSRHGLPTP